MVVDGVDEPDSDVRVVVRHQNDVKEFLALRVELPQASVDSFQGLSGYRRPRQLRSRKPACDVRPGLCDFNLDKRESGPRGKRLVLVFYLVSQILLHSLLFEHLLLALRPEQDPRRHGDGDRVLWPGLRRHTGTGRREQRDKEEDCHGGMFCPSNMTGQSTLPSLLQ